MGLEMLATKKQLKIMCNLNQVSSIEMDYFLKGQEEKKLSTGEKGQKSEEKNKEKKEEEKEKLISKEKSKKMVF